MKRTTKLKVLVLSLAMAIGLLSSMTCLAQSDGFFRDGGNYMNRDGGPSSDIVNQGFGDDGGNTVTNQSFGEAPVGSGLLILTAIGAGYAVLKKKKH
ncbi:MAG: hypothetical protein IKR33_04570 [Bacteroidales bacterium]|nr:hypothetical protein [Bacteroidales bacterium]